jgi:23S rRNA pseudouridine2605 synthase
MPGDRASRPERDRQDDALRALLERHAPHALERPAGEKLQKVLARAGVASRRAVEELVEAGRVTVNGSPAHLGQRVDAAHDLVEVDGAAIGVRPGLVHYVLNKPAGVVTTASDPQGRPTVLDGLPPEPRVFPVGRLDRDTEGLLLLTNDGELAHRLTHPRFGVDKEYLAHVVGHPRPEALRRLRRGVELDDGPTAPARVAQVDPGVLRIVVHEGRNRQVRRMCEAVGHPVRRLVRVRIGPLSDHRLAPGEWRQLAPDEVRALERAVVAHGPGGPGPRSGAPRPRS